MATHHVFIWRPDRPTHYIREADAEILVTGKRSWAVLPGRKYLIGTSAFYTRPSAERAKLGALRKIVERTALMRMPRTEILWASANFQLSKWKATGVIN